LAEFSTGKVRCAQCGSRLDVLETASGGRTIAVTGLGLSVERSARALERFFPPDAGPDLKCPACDAVIDPKAPFRASNQLRLRRRA
jgi:hypothetical protein